MDDPPDLFNSDGTRYLNATAHYRKIRAHLNVNIPEGGVVGIKLAKEPYYLLCMLACMEIGIAYVPLKEDFPENRIKEIQEDSQMDLIIDHDYLSSILQNSSHLEQDKKQQNKSVLDKAPLYIIFTSGSSGRPKGVVISRGAFMAYLEWFNKFMHNVHHSDRVLQVTEFTFDISLNDIILYLTKKTPLYFSGFNGVIFKLAQEIAKHKITVLNTVPNNLNLLLSDFIVSKANFTSLQFLLVGGARFSHGLYQKVCNNFSDKEVTNFYGPTEFTIYSHAKKITFDHHNDCDKNNVSIGIPNKYVHAEIYREDTICPSGQKGELLLTGNQIMNEYINNPVISKKAIIDIDGVDFYKTGDLAFKNDNGDFFVTGRLDETIKYSGYRINLLDIDSYVGRLVYVQDVATIAVEDDIKENIVVCYIIPEFEYSSNLTVRQVKTDLKSFLVDYQIPEKIIFIEAFPINVSGKVCRKQLLQMYNNKQLAKN